MVRKIPVRKHRGVKDPLVQLARRNACPSINAAPSKPDDQEVPKSILEIQRLCSLAEERVRMGKRKKKQKGQFNPIDSLHLFDKDPKLPGMRRRDKIIPRVVQRDDEPDEAYIHRFSAAAQEFMNEVKLENKHDVKFKLGSKRKRSGDSESNDHVEEKQVKKPKQTADLEKDNDQFEAQFISMDKKKSRKSRFLKKTSDAPLSSRPNKSRRRKLRLALLKKEEHHEDEIESPREEIDFDQFKDEVKFGEVVHRPPQFSVKPHGSQLCSKPGTKDLLLKKMMNQNKGNNAKLLHKGSTLSNAQKHFMEKERLRVVQAYRDLKARKNRKVPT